MDHGLRREDFGGCGRSDRGRGRGSFVKGAELLGLTASGVSRAISRLEVRLGVRLLDRTTRSVMLTDEGRRFYEEAKPHLAAIEDAAVLASGAASAVRGRLKVDIDPFFLPLVLAGRLGDFCDRYPELSIEFVSTEHLGDLVSEGIDLAIRFGQPRFSTLVARKLIEAPILTVASPKYIARHGRPKHPSDLVEASLPAISRSAHGKTIRLGIHQRGGVHSR